MRVKSRRRQEPAIPAPQPTPDETKQQVEPIWPERSLPFAAARHDGDNIWNLWSKPTTARNWWLAETEGNLRAIAVLRLEIQGATSVDKAATMGRIFARIARDQLSRRRTSIEIEAIAAFWALIGELAAAYTTTDRLGHAAGVVCSRGARNLAADTEWAAEASRLWRRRARKAARS